MTYSDLKYIEFALCKEMLETIEIVENFKPDVSKRFVKDVLEKKKIFITGEGSSRIFPGKHFKDLSLSFGTDYDVIVEGASQALEFQLNNQAIFGVSNSGKTKELVSLFKKLNSINYTSFYGLSATPDSTITQLAEDSEILKCGTECAVAATKSVVEQALFFESLFYNYVNHPMESLDLLSQKIRYALEMPIDSKLIEIISNASIIYFAGRNNGVAEELALKTNEITRKKSDFLEGTYALHGIEEVMNQDEVVIIIDPFEQEEQKFKKILVDGIGMNVIAIASRQTCFPTILIPEMIAYKNYIELAAGWNMLVETGLHLGVNLDKPHRARKIGNEA